MSKYSDKIYALSTHPGKSAIAIIRISGSGLVKILKKITLLKKITPNKTYPLFLKHKGASIDQVIVTYYKSPNSFTGEDIIEINCHGGQAVINKISKTLEELGIRLAEPGEFTKRALLNDKIDLIKTESISDIINAETDKQREIAVKNIEGELSGFIKTINDQISTVLANLEALIDFSDEDLPNNILIKIKEQNKNIIKKIQSEIINAEISKPIFDGVKVVIVGKPNTGKSSFINYISKRDVSIVTDMPGTTTDSITSTIEIKGVKFTFYDTAGLRKHKNKVEEVGIKKTKEHLKNSNMNLVFLKNNEVADYRKINNKIFIKSKSDLVGKTKKNYDFHNISSLTGEGVDSLLIKIYKKALKKTKKQPILSRERHISIMKKVLNILKSLDFRESLDVLAYEYRLAYNLSMEINHKFDIEDILDIIFKDFCIGK